MNVNLKIVVFGLLATLVFLGLAIAGAGGIAAFFSHPARTVTAIAALAMAVAASLTQGNVSSGEREDRANRWVLWVFAVIGLPSAFLPPFSERLEFWTFGGEGVRWLGVALYIVGVLRMAPVFVLGKRFSGLVAIQPGHTLMTDGIYRVIRHPSYL